MYVCMYICMVCMYVCIYVCDDIIQGVNLARLLLSGCFDQVKVLEFRKVK